ncbi:MAG: hypothetical protein ACJARS_001721, partial [bacterium]
MRFALAGEASTVRRPGPQTGNEERVGRSLRIPGRPQVGSHLSNLKTQNRAAKPVAQSLYKAQWPPLPVFQMAL